MRVWPAKARSGAPLWPLPQCVEAAAGKPLGRLLRVWGTQEGGRVGVPRVPDADGADAVTWVKIDDKMVDHPKIAVLSHGAFHAHIAGLCYCSQHLTDGHVPLVIAHRLVSGGKKFADELVTGGVWERKNGGYAIHDYLDFQLSREDIQKRVEAGRKGGQTSRPPSTPRSEPEACASEKPKQTGSKPEATRAPRRPRELALDTHTPTDKQEPPTEVLVAARPRNEQWDGLVAVFLYSPKGKTEQGHWGKLCAELKRMEATAQMIEVAAERYRKTMPDVELTPAALVRHYERLMANEPRRGLKLTPADLIAEVQQEEP